MGTSSSAGGGSAAGGEAAATGVGAYCRVPGRAGIAGCCALLYQQTYIVWWRSLCHKNGYTQISFRVGGASQLMNGGLTSVIPDD